MKSFIAVFALVVSANSFAYSTVDSSVLTIASPFLSSATTSGSLPKAEANKVINDAQELMQSGKPSEFLSAKIKLVQDSDASISEMEAVEVLIDHAEAILAN